MADNNDYNKAIKLLAKLFKNRDNPFWLGAITGEVVKAPPELQVKLENGIVIKNHKIMVAEEKKKGYTRTYELKGKLTDITINATTENLPCGLGKTNQHGTIKGSGDYSAEGTISWTDTLKVGDIVLMLPTNQHKYFYLIDKVVRL